MTADDSLAAIRLKIERAREHLRGLQDQVTAFLAMKPYKVADVTTTPPALPVIAGDVLQNLRSALDHLAYRLEVVGLRSAPADPRYIAYPISDGETTYPSLRDQRIKSARQEAEEALLLTVGSAFRAFDLGAELSRMMRESSPIMRALPRMKAFMKPADRLFPLKVGDELYIGGADHPVNAEMEFSFDVALAEPGIISGEPLLETLQQMADVVDRIVADFTPHLA